MLPAQVLGVQLQIFPKSSFLGSVCAYVSYGCEQSSLLSRVPRLPCTLETLGLPQKCGQHSGKRGSAGILWLIRDLFSRQCSWEEASIRGASLSARLSPPAFFSSFSLDPLLDSSISSVLPFIEKHISGDCLHLNHFQSGNDGTEIVSES